MDKRKSLVGIGLILALMVVTGYLLFRDMSFSRLTGVLRQLKGLIQRQLVPGGDMCQCQPLRLHTLLQAGKNRVFGLAVLFRPEVGD